MDFSMALAEAWRDPYVKALPEAHPLVWSLKAGKSGQADVPQVRVSTTKLLQRSVARDCVDRARPSLDARPCPQGGADPYTATLPEVLDNFARRHEAKMAAEVRGMATQLQRAGQAGGELELDAGGPSRTPRVNAAQHGR